MESQNKLYPKSISLARSFHNFSAYMYSTSVTFDKCSLKKNKYLIPK